MGTSKTLGIIGICTGWFIPLAGIVLGIIGLCLKKDKNKVLNTISIVEGTLFWIFWSIVSWSILINII